MRKITRFLVLICIFSLLAGSNWGQANQWTFRDSFRKTFSYSKASPSIRQAPDELKDFCYEQLWDVLLHPTDSSKSRARQDILHQLAEILSKVGYPVESAAPSRRDLSMLINLNEQEKINELIDHGIIELCLLIRDPIPIQTTLTVDCSQSIASIKDFRQVNDGIFSQKKALNGPTTDLIDNSSKMKELGMQSIRTHDAFGLLDTKTKKLICGLDMHYLYPDTSKDPLDPASYQFDIMDKWVAKIHEMGATVFFRIGESWGMDPTPPKNVDHYVQAVVQIQKHYQQGWANGFNYHIPYWEIWNEPGLKQFWTGTPDQFIQLYSKIAVALKETDPTIMVGGPGNAGNFQRDWYFKFLAYLRDHHVPFDFYSWHWYGIRPFEVTLIARDVQKDLASYGFYHTQQMITEWNIDVWGSIEGKKVGSSKEKGNQFFDSSFNAAFHGCALTHLQDTPVIMAHHYRGDMGGFGLLKENGEFSKVGMFYRELNSVMATPERLNIITDPVQEAFTGLAGRSNDGSKIQILLCDARMGENPYELNLIHLPIGKQIKIQVFRLQTDGKMKVVETKEMISEGKISLSLTMPAPTFDRIEISLIP